jgi:hypothetical protein
MPSNLAKISNASMLSVLCNVSNHLFMHLHFETMLGCLGVAMRQYVGRVGDRLGSIGPRRVYIPTVQNDLTGVVVRYDTR